MSGFHLDVQCSDRYKGFRGSYTLPGRFSVYVSEGICKRNKRQRFPFGSVMGQGPFQISRFMQYVLRLTPCTSSFRVSRAYEGQTVSGPGVASFHLKLRGEVLATGLEASSGSQPDAGSPKVSTGYGFTFLNTCLEARNESQPDAGSPE